MRCLYCGKELALLKRLTNSADFCSEAHRQSYQAQFNELALGRLEQARQAHALNGQPEEEEPVEIGAGIARAGIRGSRNWSTASGSGYRPGLRRRLPSDPEEAPLVPEWFAAIAPGEAGMPQAEPPEDSTLGVRYPERDPFQVNLKCEHRAPEAGCVRPPASDQPFPYRAVPRGRATAPREFSRTAAPPVPRIPQGETVVPAATHEEREIDIAPRKSAKGTLWRSRGPELTPLEPTLGAWSRPEGGPLGREPWVTVSEPAKASAGLAILERAVTGSPALESEQPVSQEFPELVTTPLRVTLHGTGPGAARFSTILSLDAASAVQPRIPAAGGLPLRPLMILVAGQDSPARDLPEPPAVVPNAAAKTVENAVENKPQAAVSQPAGNRAPAPAARTNDSSRVVKGVPAKVRRDVRVIPAAPTQAAPKVQSRPDSRPQARIETPKDTRPEALRQEPARQEVKPETAKSEAVKPEVRAARPAPESLAHKSAGSHQFIPDMEPPVKSASQTAADDSADFPTLKLETTEGPLARLGTGPKLAIAAVVIAGLGGLAYLALSGGEQVKTVDANASAGYEVSLPVANIGWIENWAPENSGKRITLMKNSQPLSHYRVEFSGQIDQKAIGWVFRAMNPRNYYVAKLEALTPGLEPDVALVRYAVIDGKAETRTETLLPFPSHLGMTYKIRFEAVGSRFTAWVNDKKVEEWRDTRIGSGGVGMYAEADERAKVNGIVNVTTLVPK